MIEVRGFSKTKEETASGGAVFSLGQLGGCTATARPRFKAGERFPSSREICVTPDNSRRKQFGLNPSIQFLSSQIGI